MCVCVCVCVDVRLLTSTYPGYFFVQDHHHKLDFIEHKSIRKTYSPFCCMQPTISYISTAVEMEGSWDSKVLRRRFHRANGALNTAVF